MSFKDLKQRIASNDKTWLVTGAAGFICSHHVESLLRLNQRVVAIDNFSSGSQANLDAIADSAGAERYAANFNFVEGDISDFDACESVCQNVDYVLHHAAQSSVPVSIEQYLEQNYPQLPVHAPVFRDPRPGEVRHSLGDISKLRSL
ncbi:MAG: NAD-dependent epimerase/dehydratase family protein [Gammaproteobacteria bacterium]|nr:NAD-dependent epimerase/dehydratase family protein [Gammaproteobacteria bacterium]